MLYFIALVMFTLCLYYIVTSTFSHFLSFFLLSFQAFITFLCLYGMIWYEQKYGTRLKVNHKMQSVTVQCWRKRDTDKLSSSHSHFYSICPWSSSMAESKVFVTVKSGNTGRFIFCVYLLKHFNGLILYLSQNIMTDGDDSTFVDSCDRIPETVKGTVQSDVFSVMFEDDIK